ncbi:MAG: CRP-like cAMP-binding protein [Bermanella sp.]|jgi:CRP-like cAMP-binding protein
MFYIGEIPNELEPLIQRAQVLSEKLMVDFDGESEVKSFQHTNQVLDLFGEGQLGQIKSGLITVVSKGVEMACFEPGDLVGIGRIFGLPYADMKVEEPVEVCLINRDEFVAYVNSDSIRQHRWSNYLLTVSTVYQQALIHLHLQVQVQTPKGFKMISAGEEIIKQGKTADTVYQLMSGSADVTVNNVAVGEVLNGEIFGAMSVFTGEKRNATVTAREDCQLLAIPKAQFSDLIRAQPETAITLLDNMSRRITALNAQVAKQQKESTQI